MKRKLLHIWLYSYLFILFLPIGVSMIVLLQSQNLLNHEVRRANDALLVQIQQSFDNQLKDIRRLGMQLSSEPKLLKYLSQSQLDNAQTRSNARELISGLHSYSISNGVILDFFIYFKEHNYALTTTTLASGELLYEMLHSSSKLSLEEWKMWLMDFHSGEFANLNPEHAPDSAEEALVYIQSIPLHEVKEANATLVVLLNQERLMQSVGNIQLANEGQVMILQRDGRVILSTGAAFSQEILSLAQMPGAKGAATETINGEKAILSYLASEESDWTYVSLLPANVYSHKVTQLKNLTYISLLLCIILGGALAYWLAMRNYRPIRKMMDQVSSKVKANLADAGNEYSILQAFLTESASVQLEFHNRLQEQHKTLRGYFLARLLKGRVDTEAALAHAFKSFDFEFETDCFAVLLIQLEDYHSLFRSGQELEQEKKNQFVYLIVTNIVEELINRNHRAYSTEIDGMIACLVNVRGNPADAGEELRRAAADAHFFLQKNFFIQCSIGLSDIHSPWSSVPFCYEQAAEALEYKLVLGASQVIPFGLVNRPKNELYYPLELERQLMNLMAIGSYDEATAVVQNILQTNFADGTLSIQMGKVLMFELVGTMLKAVEQIELSTKEMLVEKSDLIRQLTECGTFTEMETEIFDFLKLVCDYMQQKKRSHNTLLKEEIIAYLEDHLDDAGISLSGLSLAFNVNASYLSKFFREQTGENLNEYLNMRRVEKAKLLLVQNGDTVNEISEKCGFTNVNTFIRVFKKYEGITPGQFRQKEV